MGFLYIFFCDFAVTQKDFDFPLIPIEIKIQVLNVSIYNCDSFQKAQ